VLSCSDDDACKGADYEEILRLSEEGLFQVGDCAVICPTNEMSKQFQQYLNARDLQSAVHTDADFDILEARVKILTIHSAKGLEFPVVFVVGLTEGRLPRSHRGELDEEEAAIALEQDRILLYVAMTRAAEMLYLVTCRNQASRFLGELSGMALQRNLW
jgi:DNA helicase IV